MQIYLRKAAKRLKLISNRSLEALRVLSGSKQSKMDCYSDKAPHPQNILDLFENEWASKFPIPYDQLKAGKIELFSDSRLEWALSLAGDITGKQVLELGPLEGGHSYMLQQHGASVIAIEANPRAYLKCLAVKQILNLDQVQFLYGDFTKYLDQKVPFFDLCVACGVLYHMRHPVELIAQISKCASKMFVWTHYYDNKICSKHPKLKNNLKTHVSADCQGFKHRLHKHNYGVTGGTKFFGGPAAYSNWLNREDILEACNYFGFKNIEICAEHDTLDHVHGPAFAFFASK
jgi:hypothetical protein